MAERCDFPAEALDRLAAHIVRGDVVFFIGAGFSVDVEGNTASRLVQRLLLRLLAFGECTPPGPQWAALRRELRLRNELKETFELAVAREADDAEATLQTFPFSKADVDKLAYRYYETNEWFCNAFARMLRHLASAVPDPADREALARRVSDSEHRIREGGMFPPAEGPAVARPLDVTLQSADQLAELLPKLLEWANQPGRDLWRYAGKALFLDTLGFRDGAIMRGAPEERRAREVADSYGGRLLPRHHVLARFAREGLCTTTLTANYDLLLEGAFRLAGFHLTRGRTGTPSDKDDLVPSTNFANFARIAGPTAFFSDGKAHRTPVLVKMHGCVSDYRKCTYENGGQQLIEYLPSMVFTYREIQNWRRDSWAADFLRTLLRTRTVVFSGYSLQDPVIHDTFRTVYEEMASLTPVASAASKEPVRPEDAPAFFFAPGQDKREFYGLEVLQAASVAVGAQRASGDHPNYLRFHFRGGARFPDLDDLFLWLQHRVQRLHQAACLETHLRRTIAVFLGRPRPLEELEAVRQQFAAICQREDALADSWRQAGNTKGRYEHGRLCGWTDAFHPGVLREFAAVDFLQQQKGPGTELARMRRFPWYYPASQDARWTCWAVLLEIAIRRMAKRALGADEDAPDHDLVWSGQGQVPTVLIGRKGQAPTALAIYLAGFDPDAQLTRIRGCVARHCSWQLAAGYELWPRAAGAAANRAGARAGSFHRVALLAPPTDVIWNWACRPWFALHPDEARRWLGYAAVQREARAAG